MEIKAGSAAFAGATARDTEKSSRVYVNINGKYKGVFSFIVKYRNELTETLGKLTDDYSLSLVSGDNASQQKILSGIFPASADLLFNCSPQEKLDFVKALQEKNRTVLMVGDGLNDAGALKQSDAGISVSSNLNNFSPACDAILEGKNFHKLPLFLNFARKSKWIIGVSLMISLLYNAVGLTFAVQGLLSPVFAAVFMPLSSITVVGFVTIAVNLAAARMKL